MMMNNSVVCCQQYHYHHLSCVKHSDSINITIIARLEDATRNWKGNLVPHVFDNFHAQFNEKLHA